MWGVYRGIMDPNNGILGPKYSNINGIWALKPYYLAPWTLRVGFSRVEDTATSHLSQFHVPENSWLSPGHSRRHMPPL